MNYLYFSSQIVSQRSQSKYPNKMVKLCCVSFHEGSQNEARNVEEKFAIINVKFMTFCVFRCELNKERILKMGNIVCLFKHSYREILVARINLLSIEFHVEDIQAVLLKGNFLEMIFNLFLLLWMAFDSNLIFPLDEK